MRDSAVAAAIGMAAVITAVTSPVGARPAAAVSSLVISQEVSLDGLAVGSMTVHGPHGLLETFFPTPDAPLAPSGSFVRVFFAYSPQSAPGSVMIIAVNGRMLSTVDLGPGNAAGGVLEVPVPPSLIDQQHPNRLQVTFDLAAGSASADLLYGRLDSRTLIHYGLAALSTGLAGLETYPWSLLSTDASSPAAPVIGVALPSPPDMSEAAAAFRILSEMGRRAETQRVRVTVIPPAQLSAPDTQGGGVLVIGRLDHLPAAQRVLTSAGWHSAPEGWTAPDGSVAKAEDGIVTTLLSPWDGRTPVVLVSGATNAAVARAAAALVDPPAAPVTGSFAIVTADAAGSAPATPASIRVVGPDAADLAMGAGRAYEADLSFVAPPVGRDRAAQLNVVIPPLGSVVSAAIAVNGSQVASGTTEPGRPTTVSATVPGGLLRQGRNSIAVALSSTPGMTSALAGELTASLRLPLARPSGTDLGTLPFPFLDGSRQRVRFLLADAAPASLTAAAQAAVALGHRSAAPPGDFEAALAVDPHAMAAGANLIVLGAPETTVPLAVLARGLPQVPAGVAQVALTRRDAGVVLWLLGSGDRAQLRAVAALYSADLRGQSAIVDAAGKLILADQSTSGAGPQAVAAPPASGRGALLAALLILAAAAVLASFAVLQLMRSRRVTG